jgi:hypothetical protein
MDRREFLKKAGVGSAAVAGLPALQTMLATPAWAVTTGGNGFFFQVVSQSTTSAEQIIISGCGLIEGGSIEGGGSFTAFLPEGVPPFPITATGHWRAKKLLHFDTIGSYGQLVSGIAELKAVADVVAPFTARARVTLEIVCNIGAAGLSTGEEEGVVVTVPVEGLTFAPTSPPTGLTVFTKGFFGG